MLVVSLRVWKDERTVEVSLERRVEKESGMGGCVVGASLSGLMMLLGWFLLVAEDGMVYTGLWWKESW